ncbi:MAG: VOC family protein [Gordonia sp. (in: high G+C Gram-positive bacteria)]|uniref:VOC family protein n=1 Tax=Gordonia sp. (in: high G+C Gram-positive bacteria) TaxID=84139 RepID=UPI0039E465ED
MPNDPLSLSDVAVTVPYDDPGVAVAAYSALLGDPEPGTTTWAAANGSVTSGESAWVGFEAADPEAAGALLERRGAALGAPDARGARRGVEFPVVGLVPGAGARPGRTALDHVVFTAPSVDAAVALFAGRLGLDFRLVRRFGEVAQLFFRTRSVIVEVLAGGEVAAEFALWGLAWRCEDIEAEHARLAAAGLTLSEVRRGRKPGTRVVTVREPGLGTPTILIEQSPSR